MFSPEQLAVLTLVSRSAESSSDKVFVVGGFVRDILLGHSPLDKDIDFIVEGDAIAFAKLVHRQVEGELRIFPDFLTAKIIAPAGFKNIREIDFASSRKEVYPKPGKLPKVSPAPLKEDLKRRDFTINALAVSVSDLLKWHEAGAVHEANILDFYEGRTDLKDATIRILHDDSFVDDPTRIFRAIRYAARIEGKLERDTEALLREALAKGAFETVSKQRIANELRKLFIEPSVVSALEHMQRLGVTECLKLYPVSAHPAVTDLLQKLLTYELRLSASLMYQVLLRVFYFNGLKFLPAAALNSNYVNLGLGQSEVKKLNFDTRPGLDLRSRQNIQRLTDAGLIFSALIADASLAGELIEQFRTRQAET